MWKIILVFVLHCVLIREVRGEEGEKKIGFECKFQEDCEHIDNSTCNIDDLCECIEGFVPSYDNLDCLPLATKIGEECEIQEQCSEIALAECKNNVCVVPLAVTKSMEPTKPKEECTEDSQCVSSLVKRVCQNGTCVLGLPVVSANVSDLLTIGKACMNDTECSGEGVICKDKLCKCEESFVPAENLRKCLPKAKVVGDSCIETGQCLGLKGSVCESGKCTQPMKLLRDFGGEAVRGKVSSLLIGSTCQHDNECKHMSHALCLENVCQCQDNYVTSITSDSCLEKAKKEGDACTIDKQCEDIKGATCIQQKCIKPGVIGTKLGKENSASTSTISKLGLAAILFVKVFSV